MALIIRSNRVFPLYWQNDQGIRFHNCITALVLRILSCFGLASGIHTHRFNGRKFYLNKGSVEEWLNNHNLLQFLTYTGVEQRHIQTNVKGGLYLQFLYMTTAEKIDFIRSRFHCFTCKKIDNYLTACAKEIEIEYSQANLKYNHSEGQDILLVLQNHDYEKDNKDKWNMLSENSAEVTLLCPHGLWQAGMDHLIRTKGHLSK